MDINKIFAPLFEFFHYSVPFSDDLYQEGLYSSLGLSGILLSLLLAIAFYFIINRPSFSRWYHWLIILLVNFVFAFVIGLVLPQAKFTSLGIEYELSEYIMFGLKNAIISTLFFILWTYCLKWWYGNAKGTPKLFFGKF
jgi:hypothetical protein